MNKITKKTSEEIERLRIAGGHLANILDELSDMARPGVSTASLDTRARELASQYDCEPILLGYKPSFADRPYPAAICVSVNDCVQHGIPTEEQVLIEGDVVNIDMSIRHSGMVVDSGRTVGVGTLSADDRKLIAVTEEALAHGIKQAKPGNRIGDISAAIGNFVTKKELSVVEVLCGHGVGYDVHEPPNILNFGRPNTGPKIEVGHVYAIEPIVNLGSKEVYFDDDGDGYSVYTSDGSRSAHFEHTVAITDSGPEIMTRRSKKVK